MSKILIVRRYDFRPTVRQHAHKAGLTVEFKERRKAIDAVLLMGSDVKQLIIWRAK